MPIVNVSKDTTLALSYGEARTPWEQTKGLMFKRVQPLVFFFARPQRIDLHSWFCGGALDLVFLNDEWEVVELHREWGPFSRYQSRQRAAFLIELPAGAIFDSRTEVGDIVHVR